MNDDERKKDDDYIVAVDGLVRSYDAQATSHSSYLLTMAVIALAVSNLAVVFERGISSLLGLNGWSEVVLWIAIIIVVSRPFYYAVRARVARLQYYIVLSEVARDHLPYTTSGPPGFMERYYLTLKTRALEPTKDGNPLGVRYAISRFFEARLYVSCQKEKNKLTDDYILTEQEREVFHLSAFYSNWSLGRGYAGDKVLRFWSKTDLLLKSKTDLLLKTYRNRLRIYKLEYENEIKEGRKDSLGEDAKVWTFFEQFLDC